MNIWAKSIGLAIVLLASLTAAADDGAKVWNLDASNGASKGHTVVFVANKTSPNTMAGTAYVAFMKDGKYDGGYGLHTEGNTATIDDISAAVAKKTADKKDPKATITYVDVTADQYAAGKKAVQAYRDMKEHPDDPARETVNCAIDVMSACGMKYPYRSGLRPPNPTQFFGDIGTTNRKLSKD